MVKKIFKILILILSAIYLFFYINFYLSKQIYLNKDDFKLLKNKDYYISNIEKKDYMIQSDKDIKYNLNDVFLEIKNYKNKCTKINIFLNKNNVNNSLFVLNDFTLDFNNKNFKSTDNFCYYNIKIKNDLIQNKTIFIFINNEVVKEINNENIK